MHPKVASEALGHSTAGITLDIYSHVLPTMQEEAARAIQETLKGLQTRLDGDQTGDVIPLTSESPSKEPAESDGVTYIQASPHRELPAGECR